ncbi:MAG: DUF5666 domain-containing protein [Pseudomonadales bacterium]
MSIRRGPGFTATWLAGLVLLLAGCGGGGGGGGGPDLASGGTSGSGTVGGTSGSGVTGGGVTGFGSVIINGTPYRTSADDASISTTFVGPRSGFGEADLAPGMLVQVDWERDSDSAPREAVRIIYLPELIGPVTEALVPAAGSEPARIAVAGRTVVLAATTLVDDPFARGNAGVTAIATAAGLAAGSDRVEVSGYVLVTDPATGASRVQASRIARIGQVDASNPTETVSGVVANTSAGSFDIVDAQGGVITVGFDPAVVSDADLFDAAGSSRLREGAVVRVVGQLDGSSFSSVGEISRALDQLQPVSSAQTLPAEIRGPVTAPPDAGNVFRVDGQRVRIDGATTFEGGAGATALTVGTQVRVRGDLQPPDDGSRVLLATRIEIEPESDVSLDDLVAEAVSAPDAAGNRTFVTRIGVTVQVRATTILKDDSDLSVDGRLRLDDLSVGDFVEVDGYFGAAGRLVAVKLEREDDDAPGCELEARVRGSRVEGGARHYTIDGRPGLVVADVGDDPTLDKVPAGSFGEFEADAPGDCAVRPSGQDVDGNAIDAGFLADEIELEDGPDGFDDD